MQRALADKKTRAMAGMEFRPRSGSAAQAGWIT